MDWDTSIVAAQHCDLYKYIICIIYDLNVNVFVYINHILF